MKFAAMLAVLLAGCAGTKSNLSESRNGPLASLQVSTMEGGSPQPVAPGQTLQSGNQFLVSVGVERPSYVYLALASGGRPRVIVPDKGESPPRIEPGAVRQFPAPGKYFTLDDQLGEESIVAVFASQPLSPAQLTELFSGAERTATTHSNRAKRRRGMSHPLQMMTATRGIIREKSATNRALRSQGFHSLVFEQRPSVLKFSVHPRRVNDPRLVRRRQSEPAERIGLRNSLN